MLIVSVFVPDPYTQAYRFLNNPKITHQKLQQPHWHQVLEKARFLEETVLFIQDGSELLFNSHPLRHVFIRQPRLSLPAVIPIHPKKTSWFDIHWKIGF